MSQHYTSYPRNKIKILLLENISDAAVTELRAGGYADVKQIKGALSEDELCKAVKGVHLQGIRSKTKVTREVTSPTVSELVMEAAEGVHDLTIHM